MMVLRRVRTIGRELVLAFLAAVVLAMGNSPGVYSVLDIAASPYKFRLVQWEFANLPDKWWDLLAGALPWASRDDAEPNELLTKFTATADELRLAKSVLERLSTKDAASQGPSREGCPATNRQTPACV